MTRTSGVVAVALCALACAFPAGAGATRLPIPPNQPEADEYTPSVPDGEGNSAPDRSRDPVDVLDGDLLERLDRLGETGADVATLVASTAPGSPGGSGSRSGGGATSGSGSGAGPGPDSGEPSKSLPGAVGNVEAAAYVPSEGGLGTWLWVIVVAAVVGAVVYALRLWMSGRRA